MEERTVWAIMEEVIHDPEVAQLVEEAQRECGTLTSEELRIKKGMEFTPQFYSFL